MESDSTSPRLSRRAWAVLFGAVPLLAQIPSPSPAPTAATPEQKVQKASADVRAVSDRLAETEVPMSVEPAFTFRA